jgi:hypothetical protein
MSSLAQIKEAIRDQGGPSLLNNKNTNALPIDRNSSRGYINELIGPFEVAESCGDLRAFISHRVLDGTETAEILFQDTDDDAFLNSNAEGLEHYHGQNAGDIYYIQGWGK